MGLSYKKGISFSLNWPLGPFSLVSAMFVSLSLCGMSPPAFLGNYQAS